MDSKKILTFLLIALVLLGISFRLLYLNKDFTGEETDFVKAAVALKDTGHPIYYYSERVPMQLALWHPPMYIYLLSFFLKISESEAFARLPNILFSLAISLSIFLFCFKIINGDKGKIIGLISSAFFLINFYSLSSSVLIDIDMLSSFFIFGFIFSLLLSYHRRKNYFFVISSIFLFLALWNRFQIALMVYFLIGIYYFIKLKKNLGKYTVTGIASILSFIFFWGIYSTFIEPGNFFYFIVHNFQMGESQFSSTEIYFGSFIVNLIQFIRFFTFPGVFLIILSFLHFRKRKEIWARFLMTYSLSILIFFILIPRPAFGYTRYFASMLPPVSILIGIFLYENIKDIKRKNIGLGLISFFISLFLLILFKPNIPLYRTDGLIKSMNIIDFSFNIFASFPIFLTFFDRRKIKRNLIIILVALFLSYSFYFDTGMLTKKAYIKEAGEYIKEHTNNSELIIAPKAVAFYSERKFYENDHYKPNIKISFEFLKQYLIKCYENLKMDDEFFWPGGYKAGLHPTTPNKEKADKASYLVTYYKLNNLSYETKIGDYYIYRLKN